MRYLLIDTCSERSVIASFEEDIPHFVHHLPLGLDHSKYLMPQLAQELKKNSDSPAQFDFIGVGIGPGSYTGIRVGASIAQALAYSWNIPLVGIPSLVGYVLEEENQSFVSLIDAKLGGVYIQQGCLVNDTYIWSSPPQVITIESLVATFESKTCFITPKSKNIAEKIRLIDPEKDYLWHERNPEITSIAQYAKKTYNKGLIQTAGQLKLLYLREWS